MMAIVAAGHHPSVATPNPISRVVKVAHQEGVIILPSTRGTPRNVLGATLEHGGLGRYLYFVSVAEQSPH